MTPQCSDDSVAKATLIRKLALLLTPAERRRVIRLVVLMMGGMAVETLGIGLVVPALAILTGSTAVEALPGWPILTPLRSLTQVKLITIGMIALLGLYAIKNAFLTWLAWLETSFAADLHVALADRLFTSYLQRQYSFHLMRNSAQLVNAVTQEVYAVAHLAVAGGLRLLAECLVLIGLGVLLLAVEPIGAVAIVLFGAAAAWALLRSTRSRLQQWARERQKHDEMSMQHLQQGLGAAKEILLLGRQREFADRHLYHSRRRADAEQRRSFIEFVPRLVLEVLAVAALALLTIILVRRGGSSTSIIPTVGLFAAAAFRILPSVNRIVTGVHYMRYAVPSVDRVCHDLLTTAPVADEVMPTWREEDPGTIELRRVTYQYHSANKPAIDDVSLVIHPGESVGIVGPSGAGKSTLVNILLGLLEPTSGNVLYRGADVRTFLRRWQNMIGYVPQSVFLADDSIRRNVAFGVPEPLIADSAVTRALRLAQLEDFVSSLPEGSGTYAGERGVRLSGGQRQRLGIARALYHDPEVLVLDEATSSLDVATEREIISTVHAMPTAKTIVIVSHRLSTVELCTRSFSVHNGRVSEVVATTEGTWQQSRS